MYIAGGKSQILVVWSSREPLCAVVWEAIVILTVVTLAHGELKATLPICGHTSWHYVLPRVCVFFVVEEGAVNARSPKNFEGPPGFWGVLKQQGGGREHF